MNTFLRRFQILFFFLILYNATQGFGRALRKKCVCPGHPSKSLNTLRSSTYVCREQPFPQDAHHSPEDRSGQRYICQFAVDLNAEGHGASFCTFKRRHDTVLHECRYTARTAILSLNVCLNQICSSVSVYLTALPSKVFPSNGTP